MCCFSLARSESNILLKVFLNIDPLNSCKDLYKQLGHTRQLARGIIESQLCAVDREHGGDACKGDSGGPLNLVIDGKFNK